MRPVTSWALLVCRTENSSHQGTACGKVWEFSKLSSHKSSNIFHSVLQLLEKLLSPSCFTECYSCSFLQKFSVLNTYGVSTWSSMASLPLSLDLMELLRKWFLAVASFKRLVPHHKQNSFKIAWALSDTCNHWEKGKQLCTVPQWLLFTCVYSFSLAVKFGRRSWFEGLGEGRLWLMEAFAGVTKLCCSGWMQLQKTQSSGLQVRVG